MRKIIKMNDEYNFDIKKNIQNLINWKNNNSDIELKTEEIDIEKFKKIINSMNEEKLNNTIIEFYNKDTNQNFNIDKILVNNNGFTIYLK